MRAYVYPFLLALSLVASSGTEGATRKKNGFDLSAALGTMMADKFNRLVDEELSISYRLKETAWEAVLKKIKSSDDMQIVYEHCDKHGITPRALILEIKRNSNTSRLYKTDKMGKSDFEKWETKVVSLAEELGELLEGSRMDVHFSNQLAPIEILMEAERLSEGVNRSRRSLVGSR